MEYTSGLCSALQLRIAVYDSQIYEMMSFANLTIEMERNLNPPIFREKPYRRDLDWRDSPSKLVVTLKADDADGVNTFLFLYC